MAKPLASLGEVEIQILRLVWQNQPCSERQISDLVQQERDVARTTVLKTLQRLEVKGMLARVPDQTPIRFRAVLDEKRVLPSLIDRFVQGVLGGSPGPLVAYLANSERLSEKDIKALQAIAHKIGRPPQE
ncbi:MAG: BlaI/MecI/CopY family transcriptional regulator [Pirellulaceae bacterium]|nr:BlaI/MecI/CopY family transcriptional regulator [Pirellulaceae bacterium]